MACRSGCPTQDCGSYAACLRGAGIQIDRHGLQHSGLEKDKDRRLYAYEDARRAGLQPKSTKWDHIRAASETGGTRHTPVTTGA